MSFTHPIKKQIIFYSVLCLINSSCSSIKGSTVISSALSTEPSENIIPEKPCVEEPNVIKAIPLKFIPTLFRACVSYVYHHTRVPIVLPAITQPQQWKYEQETYYPFIAEVSSSKYWLAWKGVPKSVQAKNPIGTAQFNRGYVLGEKIGSETPTIASLHTQFKDYILRNPRGASKLASGAVEVGGTIALSNGVIGYYFPPVCGANCHNAYARIIWDHGSYRYTIAFMGGRDEIIKVANSAIENRQK